jgi:ATP-dependent Clp protease ATP-binding subunit ClpB
LAGEIDKSQPVLVDVFDNTVVFRNEVASTKTSLKERPKKATS